MTAITQARALAVPGPRPTFGGYGNLISFINDPVGCMGSLFARYGPVANLAYGAPVAWNSRVAAEDSELSGHHIPAGAEVHMSIYHTHHMAELYPQPERFDPELWEQREYGIFEYSPFSGGPRMCIGVSFAMMEIKLVLATILQRVRLEAIPGTRVHRRVHATMGPRRGLPMVVRRQDREFTRGVGGLRGDIRAMVELP